jgi:hypothetical protein
MAIRVGTVVEDLLRDCEVLLGKMDLASPTGFEPVLPPGTGGVLGH